jgi:hypothetical protein
MDQQKGEVYSIDNGLKCVIVSTVDGSIIRTLDLTKHNLFVRDMLIHNGKMYITASFPNQSCVTVIDPKNGRNLRKIRPGHYRNTKPKIIHIAFFNNLLFMTTSQNKIYTYSPLSFDIQLFRDFSKFTRKIDDGDDGGKHLTETIYNMAFSPLGIPHYSVFCGIAQTLSDAAMQTRTSAGKKNNNNTLVDLKSFQIKIPLNFGFPSTFVFSGEVGSQDGSIYLLDEEERVISIYNQKYEFIEILKNDICIPFSLQVLANGYLLVGAKDGFYILK